MGEKQAAARLESALESLVHGSPIPTEGLDPDAGERVQMAKRLAALDLAGESRVRESLRERLARELRQRAAGRVPEARRRPWVARRPVLAAELGVLLAVVLLAVIAPRSLVALVEPVIRMIEMVRVGEHTQIVRHAPQAGAEVAATLEQHRQRLAKNESWYLDTPYGGFGGGVQPGKSPRVERASSFERLRSLTAVKMQVPTCLHRDEPVRFDHAFVAPGGIALIFFGSGANELFLSAFPVGEGRSISYSRAVSRTTAEGKLVMESPELKTEEMSFAGQTVVWDPGPEPPAPVDVHWPGTWFLRRTELSALRWEEGGVSYSLMGRSLTREEAVDLFLSLRPLDELR